MIKSSVSVKRPQGRPRIMADGKRLTITLDQPMIDRARALGNGNISLGVRLALLKADSPAADNQGQTI